MTPADQAMTPAAVVDLEEEETTAATPAKRRAAVSTSRFMTPVAADDDLNEGFCHYSIIDDDHE